MDIWTKEKRSQVMSAVLSRGNRSTEQAMAGAFRREHVRGWRRHKRISLGSGSSVRPDFVFPAERIAVFVDGCFWHGCPLHGKKPSSKRSFWLAKLEANKARDRKVGRLLRCRGWRVMRIWEHSVERDRSACVRRVTKMMATSSSLKDHRASAQLKPKQPPRPKGQKAVF